MNINEKSVKNNYDNEGELQFCFIKRCMSHFKLSLRNSLLFVKHFEPPADITTHFELYNDVMNTL